MFTDTIKAIIAVSILALVIALGYFGFSYVKNLGFQEANAACEKRFREYTKQIDDRLTEVQTSVSQNAETMITSNQLLQEDLRKIGFRVSKLPTAIIVDGKCVPNPAALAEVKEAVRRVNAEMSKK